MLKQLILYNLVILMIFSCGSSEDNKDKHSAVQNADSAVFQDTVDSAITQDTMNIRPPHPKPGLPPGTARITGHVLSVADSAITIKVAAVKEYGSSTPAIGSGAPLTILIPDFLSKEVRKLQTDKKIVCLINYRQFLASDNSNSHWVLKEISSFESPQ